MKIAEINTGTKDVHRFKVEDTYDFQANEAIDVTESYLLAILKDDYYKHQSAGMDYFDFMRNNLAVDYHKGIKTGAEVFEIEAKLDGVIAKILRGDWMSAKNVLDTIKPSGALTQEYYDGIQSDLISYIQNSY